MIHHEWFQRLTKPRVAIGIVLAVVCAATVQKYLLGAEQMNNLLIFRASAWHLLANVNLYAQSPADHADLFKYSPTFALCMLPFAALPLVWSGVAWNILNSVVFLLGVYAVSRVVHSTNVDPEPKTDEYNAESERNTDYWRTFVLMLWICAVELLTAVQNFQSNALMAGLALCTLAAMERGKPMQAALFLALSFHIKIYGAAPFVLMLLYPHKTRFTLAFVGFIALFTAAPLLAVSPDNLLWQYENWRSLLQSDHAASYGLSVMSVLSPLLPNGLAVSALQGISLLVQCAWVIVIALRPRFCTIYMRLLCCTSLMLWMVIFNHKAESPTFIIAVSGVALWYCSTRLRHLWSTGKNAFATTALHHQWLHNVLLWFIIICTSLSVTDFFPESLRSGIFARVHLKVLPCIAVWLYLYLQLLQQIITPNSTTGTQFER